MAVKIVRWQSYPMWLNDIAAIEREWPPRPPRIVWWDEIEKAMGHAASGIPVFTDKLIRGMSRFAYERDRAIRSAP
jgi:hypothetical protein